MDKKRIILLLDGTWNDMDFGQTDTNIVRLLRIISRSLRKNASGEIPGHKLVSGFHTDVEHIVFYERGVGTGFLDGVRGGAFGFGLGTNVRRAYRFLSAAYRPGDEVFVFGFSRGAYTARSLVGFLGSAGLLQCDKCTAENEAMAWDYYRTSPNDRLPGVWAKLTPLVHDRARFRVTCIGVFDTVGALGIPVGAFLKANRERYAFHDVNLSSITKLNLHALAIDEHRWPFQAAVWRTPPFKRYASRTEQVWFPGAHADVGGGYVREDRRIVDEVKAIDDITLSWMIGRIQVSYPDFPADAQFVPTVAPGWGSLATVHNSRSLMYKAQHLAHRSIANLPVERPGWWQTAVGHDRHADMIGEMVHVSALERLAAVKSYRPKSLLQVLPVIGSTYSGGPDGLRVVAWDGSIYDPAKDADCRAVLDLLPPEPALTVPLAAKRRTA